MSSFWVEVRYHWPFQGGCWWSWQAVAIMLLFPVGVDSAGRFYGDVLVIVSGAIKKHQHWTILDFTPVNSMVYISPNWTCGGMFAVSVGNSDPFTALYKKMFPIYGWDPFLGVQMWFIFDDEGVEQDERFSKDNLSSGMYQVASIGNIWVIFSIPA